MRHNAGRGWLQADPRSSERVRSNDFLAHRLFQADAGPTSRAISRPESPVSRRFGFSCRPEPAKQKLLVKEFPGLTYPGKCDMIAMVPPFGAASDLYRGHEQGALESIRAIQGEYQRRKGEAQWKKC